MYLWWLLSVHFELITCIHATTHTHTHNIHSWECRNKMRHSVIFGALSFFVLTINLHHLLSQSTVCENVIALMVYPRSFNCTRNNPVQIFRVLCSVCRIHFRRMENSISNLKYRIISNQSRGFLSCSIEITHYTNNWPAQIMDWPSSFRIHVCRAIESLPIYIKFNHLVDRWIMPS